MGNWCLARHEIPPRSRQTQSGENRAFGGRIQKCEMLSNTLFCLSFHWFLYMFENIKIQRCCSPMTKSARRISIWKVNRCVISTIMSFPKVKQHDIISLSIAVSRFWWIPSLQKCIPTQMFRLSMSHFVIFVYKTWIVKRYNLRSMCPQESNCGHVHWF